MGFFRGIAYPFQGMHMILRRYPGLALWWMPPIVITFAMMVGVLWGTFTYYDQLAAWVWTEPQGEGVWAGALSVLHGIFEALLGVVVAGLSLFVVAALSSVVAAPFNDALSEAIECRETGQPAPPFRVGRAVRDAGRAVRVALGRLLLYVGVMAPLWVLSFALPGVGQMLYTGAGVLFTASYLALDYVDWPASRRGWGLRRRLGLVGRHPTLLLGFGAAVWVFLFVPILNLFFMPAAVAGGTRLFLDLERRRRESSAPSRV